MSNSITLTEQMPSFTAQSLHQHLLGYIQLAKIATIEVYRGLKEMRDEKLYLELDYETFEEYTEQALGIKRRQAYSYIKTYEDLPREFLQLNAHLGITKLHMLTGVPALELEDFAEENDLEGISTRELKELTEKFTAQVEQIGLLQKENTELAGTVTDYENRPIEVAVEQPDQKELDKMKKAAKQEAAAKYEQEIEELKNKSELAEKEHQKQVSDITSQAERLREQSKDLHRQLELAGNDSNEIFKIRFNYFQDSYLKLVELIEQSVPEDKVRFTKAACIALEGFVQQLQWQVEL